MRHKAVWQRGKQIIKGWWEYNWASDTFTIRLDRADRVTGATRLFEVYGDTPQWNNWKLVRTPGAFRFHRIQRRG